MLLTVATTPTALEASGECAASEAAGASDSDGERVEAPGPARWRVAIVGAGISVLAAALQLAGGRTGVSAT